MVVAAGKPSMSRKPSDNIISWDGPVPTVILKELRPPSQGEDNRSSPDSNLIFRSSPRGKPLSYSAPFAGSVASAASELAEIPGNSILPGDCSGLGTDRHELQRLPQIYIELAESNLVLGGAWLQDVEVLCKRNPKTAEMIKESFSAKIFSGPDLAATIHGVVALSDDRTEQIQNFEKKHILWEDSVLYDASKMRRKFRGRTVSIKLLRSEVQMNRSHENNWQVNLYIRVPKTTDRRLLLACRPKYVGGKLELDDAVEIRIPFRFPGEHHG